GLLREGGRHDEPGIEAERGRHGGGNHEVATRQVEHGPSPREKIRRRRRLRRRGQDSGSGNFIPGQNRPWGPGRCHKGLNARSTSTSMRVGPPFLKAWAMRSVVSCTVLARSAATPSERASATKSILGSTSSIPT